MTLRVIPLKSSLNLWLNQLIQLKLKLILVELDVESFLNLSLSIRHLSHINNLYFNS